jgi:hypothetical protein
LVATGRLRLRIAELLAASIRDPPYPSTRTNFLAPNETLRLQRLQPAVCALLSHLDSICEFHGSDYRVGEGRNPPQDLGVGHSRFSTRLWHHASIHSPNGKHRGIDNSIHQTTNCVQTTIMVKLNSGRHDSARRCRRPRRMATTLYPWPPCGVA